jgi:hypothetical protein
MRPGAKPCLLKLERAKGNEKDDNQCIEITGKYYDSNQ